MAYTQSQLESAEKIMKSAMSVDEISNYDALSPDDKDQYISGFIENIKEWKKAYLKGNEQQNSGQQGGTPQTPPDDGLRHWQPNQQLQQDSQQSHQQDNKKYIQDQSLEAKDAAQDAKDAAKDAQQASLSKDAQQAADAAQEAAQAAQQAASKAQNAANAAAEASENSNSPLAQQAADAAQDAADQALAAADKAQEAADKAQEAADSGDILGAQQAAQQAGQAAQQAANKAQQAANATDRTGSLSNNQSNSASQTAQNAAQQAANAAQRAKEAAAAGDLETAKDAAQEAADAAQQAGQAAQQSGNGSKQEDQAAQQAGQAAQQAGQNAENAANNSLNALQITNAAEAAAKAAQNAAEAAAKADTEYHQTLAEHSERNIKEPTLSEAQHSSSFSGKVSKQVSFSGNDVLDSNDYERAKEIAERAGQPVDSDDYDSPEKTAAKKYAEAKRELQKWKADNDPGFGNSPIDLTDTISKLFASTIDWTDQLGEFMTAKANIGSEDVMTKRYMGLDPSHPKYGSRYLHPRQRHFEKRSGIAEVFLLVDASGSMGFVCGDGLNVYEHIMSELIQLELDYHINKSAFAAFNAGPIEEDDVIVWTRREAPSEEEIAEKLPLPTAGGGTSALDAVNSINELIDIYDPDKTLLIIVTDGYDNYSQIKNVMSSDQMSNTVFLITRGTDQDLKFAVNDLTKVGVEADHIITVNTNKEWGASK